MAYSRQDFRANRHKSTKICGDSESRSESKNLEFRANIIGIKDNHATKSL